MTTMLAAPATFSLAVGPKLKRSRISRMTLAVLLLDCHDFEDEPRVAVDNEIPLEPARVQYLAPAMLVHEGDGPSQDLRAIAPRLRPVGHRSMARQR